MSSTDDKKEESILKEKISRRRALSTGGKVAAGVVVGAVVAGAGGYFAGTASAPGAAPVTETRTETAPAQTLTQTRTTTQTVGAGATATITEAGGTVTRTATAPARTVTVTQAAMGVEGATPAERAINAISQMRAEGKIPDGTRLKFMEVAFRGGNITPAAGSVRTWRDETVQGAINMLDLWESQTGIPVDMDLINDLELYEKAISEGVTRIGTWDIMSQRMDFLHDFIGADVVLPLRKFFDLYNPEFDNGPCPLIENAGWAYKTQDGEVYGFPGCADWFSLVLRRDLITNPKFQDRYETEFGEAMPVDDVPLWSQVQNLAELFDGEKGLAKDLLEEVENPELRGAYYFRDAWFSNIEFYIRFYEMGGLYMNEQGDVTLNVTNKFGRNALKVALEEMKALVPYQTTEAFVSSWQTMYPDYSAKKVFSTITWASLNQFAALGPVGAEGLGVYHIPGYVTDGHLIRSTINYDQTSYVINKHGKLTKTIPEIPFLFMQWLVDPEISIVQLANPGAISDGYRTCHFTDDRMIKTFDAVWPPGPAQELGRRGASEIFELDLKNSVPPLQLKGLKEIQDLQGSEMNAYFTDVRDLDTVANNIQEGVQTIIDRNGRDVNIALHEYLKTGFPTSLKTLHGIA